MEIRLRDGRLQWRDFEAILTNHLDDEALAGIVLNAHDVTERKAIEDMLRKEALHDSLTELPEPCSLQRPA